MPQIIHKNIGETPLEALEVFRMRQVNDRAPSPTGYDWNNAPMTYAGRLDPMAEGKLVILIGDECKDKDKYLGLDKEYEVEIVFGISTDTYDALGLAVSRSGSGGPMSIASDDSEIDLKKYVGKFTQEYPPYSSKTVKGKQLHELVREGELPDEMPTKEVEIYSIEVLGEASVTACELEERIMKNIAKVKGDFRQKKIKTRWQQILLEPNLNVSSSGKLEFKFKVTKIKVRCSSGTYMRSLASRIGKDAGIGAFASSINRISIG